MQETCIRSFGWVALLMLMAPIANGQCDRDLTFYGYQSIPSGDVTFGQIVVPAGDVDNDGYPDIVAGTLTQYFSLNASVVAYSGLNGDSIRTYYNSFTRVYAVSSFGDFNNDQYDDLLINGKVISGMTGGVLADHSSVALAARSVGDINGDGIHDIALANWGYASEAGRVDVISGDTGDTLQSWTGIDPGGRFGFATKAAGDVNNDGYDDVAIGTPLFDGGGTNRGRVQVFSGIDGTELVSRLGDAAGQEFGLYVSGAGDLDNDGHDDILVGGQFSNAVTAPLKVWAISGQTQDSLYTVTAPSLTTFHEYGSAMDGVGDLNHDNCDDFAVGANRYNNNWGNVWVYSGKDGALLFDTYSIHAVRERTGIAVAGLGDTDGDGGPDIGVGAIWAEGPGDPTNDVNYRGAVYVWRCAYPGVECYQGSDFDGDQWNDSCDNCPYTYNPGQEDADSNGIGDVCETSQTVTAGIDQTVDLLAAQSSISLTFEVVDQAGDVDMSVSTGGPAVGQDFVLVPSDPPKYYDISTDALFSGNITITISYDDTGLSPEEESRIALLHYDQGGWVDITQVLDTALNFVQGVTTSLSPFVTSVAPTPVAVDDEDSPRPMRFDLSQNFPNPFNPVTRIEYSLARPGDVSIEIFNALGQHVRNLVSSKHSAGTYSVTWDGTDARGESVGTGVYFYRLSSDDLVLTRKMLLLK